VQSRIRVNSPHVISEHIDGETVMINLKTGAYYNLNASGARVWALLPRDGSVAGNDVVAFLHEQGENEPGLAYEVAAFLDRLLDEELVVTVDESRSQGAPSPGSALPQTASDHWEAPSLTRFDDMQDLLLLDPVHEVDAQGWPHLPTDDA